FVPPLGAGGGLGTALVGNGIDVPSSAARPNAQESAAEETPHIPVTYVPARNILFLSHALAVEETRDARDIFIGVNALDYSGYPDCRPDFIAAFQSMARLGMQTGVEGHGINIRA